MPLQLTMVNVRFSTKTYHDWWKPTTEQANYIKTNYVDTGKRTEISTTGETGLTKTKVVEFTDAETKAAWDADSTIDEMIQERRAYLQSRKITHTESVENT